METRPCLKCEFLMPNQEQKCAAILFRPFSCVLLQNAQLVCRDFSRFFLRGGAGQIFSIDFPGTPRVLAISLDGLLAVEGEISPLFADTPRAYVAIHVFAVASGALVWSRR